MLAFPKPQKKVKEKTYSSIRRKTYEEVKKQVKTKPKKHKSYTPVCKYWSIFTSNLNRCYISGSDKNEADIHIHHIFGAANKHNSERRGFIIPLRADWHDTADYGIHFNKELDLKYKRQCQDYYLKHYGTMEEFIKEFGKWW